MSSLLTRALRNASIIYWWGDCAFDFRRQVRADYAARLGCDDSELGNDHEFIMDADVLDYVAVAYASVIALWEEDQK